MIFIETDIQKNTDDIHALTRAFFPGEEVRITECDISSEDMAHPVIKPENSGKGGKLVYKSCEGAMFEIEVPSEEKDELKRTVYTALSNRTGRTLPWGALTGIRPTRLIRRRMESGMTDSEIVADMKNSYFTSEEKSLLSIEIAKKEKELIGRLAEDRRANNPCNNTGDTNGEDFFINDGSYSLYVDIPFCPTRCLYCSFTSNAVGKDRTMVLDYLDALEEEIKECGDLVKGRVPDTVYVGGGTPTALLPKELERLLAALQEGFNTDRAYELTVEAGRPDSITDDKLDIMKSHGVTRISVNPQTMNQKTLDIIGRRHTVEQVKEAFYLARERGFDNINMDMILGLPGEEVSDVRHTVDELCKLGPDSLTVHSLAVKRAAAMRDWIRNAEGGGAAADASGVEAMMSIADRGARSLGMSPYYLYRQKNISGNLENTGYAKEGRHCLYNILINEEIQDILALGAGAISKRVGIQGSVKRSANYKEVHDYIKGIGRIMEKKRELWYTK